MPRFTWDREKARSNLAKHGVAFEEPVTGFADPLARIFADIDHSESEAREILVGFSSLDRLLVVSFLERRGSIRLISARLATPKERRKHEQSTAP